MIIKLIIMKVIKEMNGIHMIESLAQVEQELHLKVDVQKEIGEEQVMS